MFQITGIYTEHTKTVKFHNLTIEVPDNAKFITVNLYGEIQCWAYRPSLHTYRWKSVSWFDTLATIRYTGDWRESLQEIE